MAERRRSRRTLVAWLSVCVTVSALAVFAGLVVVPAVQVHMALGRMPRGVQFRSDGEILSDPRTQIVRDLGGPEDAALRRAAPEEKAPAEKTPSYLTRIAWGEPVNGLQAGILAPVKWPHSVPSDGLVKCCCVMEVGIYVRNQSFKLPEGSDGSVRLSSQGCEIDGAAMSLSVSVTKPDQAPIMPRLLDGQAHRLQSPSFNTSEVGRELLRGDTLPGAHEVTVRGDIGMTVHLIDGRGNIIGAPISVRLRTGAAKSSITVDEPEEPAPQADSEHYQELGTRN